MKRGIRDLAIVLSIITVVLAIIGFGFKILTIPVLPPTISLNVKSSFWIFLILSIIAWILVFFDQGRR